tara:strand:- start:487 stop:996 length:510 start_codon:yes stop_codon:yes gene_type:complete
MGSKRIGLARTQALIENLKRELDWNGATLTDVAALTTTGAVTAGTSITATSGDITLTSGMVEYADGGAVTQGTSKSTTVVLSKPTGKITMHAAALAADAIVTFTVTNTHARATDVVVVNHHSGGTVGAYTVQATGHAAGSFKITVTNVSAGSLSEALVLHYVLVKTAHT